MKLQNKLYVTIILIIGFSFMSCNKAPYIELPRASYKISNADICIMHNKIISKAKESFTVKSEVV